MPDGLDRKYQLHTVNLTSVCRFATQAGVLCDRLAHCETCGWNPEVYEDRRKKTRAALACLREEPKRERWIIGRGTF